MSRSLICLLISTTVAFTSVSLWEAVFSAPVAEPAGSLTSVYNAYLERLRPRIERGWVVPDGHNTVVLEVVVNADGTTGAVTIAPSQHTEEAALAARWAFAAAQPLEPLPSGSPNQAKLTITFESKAGQHESTAHLSTRLEPLPSGSASGSADGGS